MVLDDLKELEKESIRRQIPVIGSEKGEWLLSKIKEVNPQNILELGTANGYSGIILGSQGAELVTIDKSKKIIEEAKQNFEKFGTNAKIIYGDVVEEIKKLDDKFDLIFIDFEKNKYVEVLEDCLRLVSEKGVIITDNILMDKCKDFRELILKDPRLTTQIIETGDGLACSVPKVDKNIRRTQ